MIYFFEFTGECWSGPNGDETYGKLGPSTNCLDKCYESCNRYEPFCAGKEFANAVYIFSGKLLNTNILRR